MPAGFPANLGGIHLLIAARYVHRAPGRYRPSGKLAPSFAQEFQVADSPNASPAPARALEGQKLLLCVGGGIAAYKALELVRRLREDFSVYTVDSERINIASFNDSNIDYFGTTVNFAAKLQACADGSQVAFSEAVAQREEVCAWLEEQGLRAEESSLANAALGTPRVWRFTVG